MSPESPSPSPSQQQQPPTSFAGQSNETKNEDREDDNGKTQSKSDSTNTKENKPKRISNPRRLLVLAPTAHAEDTIPPLLHTLTGVPVSAPPQAAAAPSSADADADVAEAGATKQNPEDTEKPENTPRTTTFAGYTSHAPLRIQNRYYTADVPIWVDEVPVPSSTSSSEEKKTSASQTQTPTPEQWKTEFLGADARVVRDAIGAVVLCVRNPEAPSPAIPIPRGEGEAGTSPAVGEREDVRALKDLIKTVGEVKSLIEEERGGLGEVPGLLVLVGGKKSNKSGGGSGGGNSKQGGFRRLGDMEDLQEEEEGPAEPFTVGWWEDELYEMGVMEFEVVAWDPKTDDGREKDAQRNRFGEFEGMRRIREVLETHEWAASSSSSNSNNKNGDGLSDSFLDDDDEDGFAREVDELEREMMGLRMAIEKGGGDGYDSDDDDGDDHDKEMKVEGLESLMMRMQAIKDMSAELPEHERKAFAAKAVRDIMKEL